MTSVGAAVDPDAGVLLVHGIGSQRPGSTLRKFVSGLRRGFPDLKAEIREADAVVTLGERRVFVYEVYWADLLEAERVEGTFSPLEFNSLAWFPWLNRKARVYPRRYTLRVYMWTALLSPLALCGLIVGVVIAALYYVFTRQSLFALLERTIGDVTNYVASAGRVVEAEPIASVADEVMARFRAAHSRAVDEGCRDIYVVAHSLGTVIAYHALSGHLTESVNADAAVPPLRVRGLFTIGSPLEKIRFIWPTLIETRPLATAKASANSLVWENFHDRLDLISGRLRHADSWGPVQNHGLFGRGGLGRAHTVYQGDPAFLRAIGRRLFDARSQARLNPLARAASILVSLAESVAVVVALLAPLFVAAVITAVLALAFAAVVTLGSYLDTETAQFAFQVGFDETFRISLWLVGSASILAIVLGPIALGRAAAAYAHYAFLYHGSPPPRPPAAPKTSWWRHSVPLRIAGRTMLVAAIMTAGFIIGGQMLWEMADVSLPWAPGQTIAHRIGVGTGVFFYSLLVDLLLFLLVVFVAVVGRAAARYRRWVEDTTRPPTHYAR